MGAERWTYPQWNVNEEPDMFNTQQMVSLSDRETEAPSTEKTMYWNDFLHVDNPKEHVRYADVLHPPEVSVKAGVIEKTQCDPFIRSHQGKEFKRAGRVSNNF